MGQLGIGCIDELQCFCQMTGIKRLLKL
jgi:hypothetical protein